MLAGAERGRVPPRERGSPRQNGETTPSSACSAAVREEGQRSRPAHTAAAREKRPASDSVTVPNMRRGYGRVLLRRNGLMPLPRPAPGPARRGYRPCHEHHGGAADPDRHDQEHRRQPELIEHRSGQCECDRAGEQVGGHHERDHLGPHFGWRAQHDVCRARRWPRPPGSRASPDGATHPGGQWAGQPVRPRCHSLWEPSADRRQPMDALGFVATPPARHGRRAGRRTAKSASHGQSDAERWWRSRSLSRPRRHRSTSKWSPKAAGSPVSVAR